jgi:hypothetical protein
VKVNGLVLVKARSITNEFCKPNEGELKIMKQLGSKTLFKMKKWTLTKQLPVNVIMLLVKRWNFIYINISRKGKDVELGV